MFTFCLRRFAQYRLAQLAISNPQVTQESQLSTLLKAASRTKFGTDHGFSEIKTVAEYQRRVPLFRYEQMWERHWKPSYPILDNVSWPGRVPFFALSSGTSSGTTKYLPVTYEMIRSNKIAGTDLRVHHLNNRSDSRAFDGSSFVLGGSTDLRDEAPGVMSGDLSGIAVKTLPWWAKLRYFPPPELALLKNWEEKIEKIGRASLTKDIRTISGVPSWMLILFKRLAEYLPSSQGKLKEIYPNLEMIVHGGVAFGPYRDQFLSLLEGSKAELREVYPASEGFIAVADRGYNEGLRLVLDHGIFFEFVPVEEIDSPTPTRHWVGNVQPGINYAVVLTTCAGRWSYVIGDTVRVVDVVTPRLLVTGRVSYYLSAFGEHLIAEEIDDAVSSAASAIQRSIDDYSIGALYPQAPGELGGHLIVVEFREGLLSDEQSAHFSKEVDARLRARNEDYDAHRAEGFGLNPPRILAVKPGTFAAWMKSRGKLGGQNKVPRIITSPELFKNLQDFCLAP